MWKTIEADGCVWQVRSVDNPDAGVPPGQHMLVFQTEGGNRPPRRVVVEAESLDSMDADAIRSAYLRSLPIGGDHYGRPGKQMNDIA